jgi:sec-independent protein translocase protein TatA
MPSAVLTLAAAPAPALAFLEGIGAMEMILVAVIGLLLFGGKGLPDMARTLGKVVREFKKATANVESEVKRVMNEEPEPAPKPRPATRNSSPPPATPPPAAS